VENVNTADTDRLNDTKWYTDNFTATVHLSSIAIMHQQTCRVENTI